MSATEKSLVDQAERIVALDDQPVLRNLLITQAYHDLSDAMTRLVGRDSIIWVTMASWSSKTVGRFIRNDEVPELFKRALQHSAVLQRGAERLSSELRGVHPSLGMDPLERLLSLGDRVIGAVSAYLTLGNKIVFAELGTIFAKFIRAFEGETDPDDRKLRSFLDQLTEGPPEPDLIRGDPFGRQFDRPEGSSITGTLTGSQRGGQSLLRDSMHNYYRAMFTRDRKAKAELILLANAQGGLHEQTRLQPYIAGSLNAASSDLLYNENRDSLVQITADRALIGPLRTVLDRLLKPLSADFDRVFREFATAEMMKLKLPDGELRLGSDVPAVPGRSLYPPALQRLGNVELRSVLRQYGALDEEKARKGLLEQATATAQGLLSDLGLGSRRASGSGAGDWTDPAQRMRYIFELFRARGQDGNLFQQPFSAAQRRILHDGEIPRGALY